MMSVGRVSILQLEGRYFETNIEWQFKKLDKVMIL